MSQKRPSMSHSRPSRGVSVFYDQSGALSSAPSQPRLLKIGGIVILHCPQIFGLAALLVFSSGATSPSPSARERVPCNDPVTFISADNPVSANTTGHEARFRFTNVTSVTTTSSAACSSTLKITCTGVSPTSVTLAPGASATIFATFNAGAPGFGFITVSSCSASKTSPKIFVN